MALDHGGQGDRARPHSQHEVAGPCVRMERCTVISDRAELETFASRFSASWVCAFSMGYRSQKSCADDADFCEMFRTV
jgi:hypothetical protein